MPLMTATLLQYNDDGVCAGVMVLAMMMPIIANVSVLLLSLSSSNSFDVVRVKFLFCLFLLLLLYYISN